MSPLRRTALLLVNAVAACALLAGPAGTADGQRPTGESWARVLPPADNGIRVLPPDEDGIDVLPLLASRANVPRPRQSGIRVLPPATSQPIAVAGAFPPLPPDPADEGLEPLPPLDEELALHGGAHLYAPEGDVAYQLARQQDGGCQEHARLRLPERYCAPQPLTWFQDYLGADPIGNWPLLHWPGCEGFPWEPRLVVYGANQFFFFDLEEGDETESGLGVQLLLDFDLRLTGTERFHVQYRPLGRDNTGGSFYRFTSPSEWVNNATGTPDRYWFEGELFSLLGGILPDEFHPRDYHVTAGRFPFLLQNALLMNDDVMGVAVNKNNIYLGRLSNLNVQGFYMFKDVDAFDAPGLGDHESATLAGGNFFADYKHSFLTGTYAFLHNRREPDRDTHYAALSLTRYMGTGAVTARVMGKFGDEGGSGDGQLYVLEANRHRVFDGGPLRNLGFEHGVYYANAFGATRGWRPISGGNFDRLRSSFELNPLVSIARGTVDDTYGVSGGVQLFRHHDDASLTPEIAWEAVRGESVFGVGLGYLRKTGPRSFIGLRGLANWSDDPDLQRAGLFVSQTILF